MRRFSSRIDLRDLLEVQRPGLADERADRREASRPAAAAPGRPRRATSRRRVMPKAAISAVSKRLAREQLEERLLLRVGGREAGLDQVHAERVERVRHAHLLVGRQRHALALHAVAQGGVVDETIRGLTPPDPRGVGRGRLIAGSRHACDGTGTRSSQSA